MSASPTFLPMGQWADMTDRQRAAWKAFRALVELDLRARTDPRFLDPPPRPRAAEPQPRS